MYTIAQKQRFTVINERTKRQYLRMQRRKAAVRKRFYCSVALLAISVLLIFGTAHITNAGTQDTTRTKYFTSIQVESGTNLWDIAQEYMTEEYDSPDEYIKEVKAINHMKNDLIYGGSYLCIPYYSAETK